MIKTQFFSLLKAVLTQDMSIFKYKIKDKNSRLKKLMFPILIGVVVMNCVGSYAYIITEMFAPLGLAFVTIALAIAFTTVVTFLEGVYKSGSILFDSKDNDLLLSLPLKRHQIFTVRICKLLIFQIIFNSIFLLPTYAVYAFFEHPSFTFYPLALLSLLLLPLIPTALAALVGSLVRQISVRFKAQKVVQTILLFVALFGFFVLLMNEENFFALLTENAESIGDTLRKVYYPLGLFIGLIQEFHFLDLLGFIMICILPLAIVVWIGSRHYFQVISRSRAHYTITTRQQTRTTIHSPMSALVRKELSRFFSTTVYMFNTLPGVFILPIATIALVINSDDIISKITELEELGVSVEQIYNFLPLIFLAAVCLIICTTSVTASSISIEGKSFELTKTLPISSSRILLAKIIASDIITTPLIIVSCLIFIVRFAVSPLDAIWIILSVILYATLIAMIGLLVNLKYPKMNATSDAEVIKQSGSVMISMLLGLVTYAAIIGTLVGLSFITNLAIFLALVIFSIVTYTLWCLLKSYGQKRFLQINS